MFLLIDLKLGKLTHQDVGQMDSYVRIYDQHRKGSDDNPTIGLILCSQKSEAVAKYSILTESKQLFASKYLPYLPTEEELRYELERERAILNELPGHDRNGTVIPPFLTEAKSRGLGSQCQFLPWRDTSNSSIRPFIIVSPKPLCRMQLNFCNTFK